MTTESKTKETAEDTGQLAEPSAEEEPTNQKPGRVRAVRSEVERSEVLSREARAVVLKNDGVVDVSTAGERSAGGEEGQPESDLYGHPDQEPSDEQAVPPGVDGTEVE